jgi:hypothetical protein
VRGEFFVFSDIKFRKALVFSSEHFVEYQTFKRLFSKFHEIE